MSILRHNNVRNITAELSKEVCHDVKAEPQLQQSTGERVSENTVNTRGDPTDDVSKGILAN